MELVGGTGGPGAEWVAALNAQLDRMRISLAAGPPFPVVGLAEPALTPAVLAEYQQCDDEWEFLGLTFGDQLSAAGPLVSVVTTAPGVDLAPLAEMLAAERDRLWALAQVDEPDPVDGTDQDGLLLVDGRRTPARIRREGGTWAARARLDAGTVVTVVGRGVGLGEVRLAAVDSFAPFLDGREAELERLRAAHHFTSPEELELPPARGLEAHEALVRLCLRETEEIQAAGAERRRPRPSRRRNGGEYTRAWEAATRAQMRYAGQERHEANAAVTAMVNQAVSLAGKAPWWTEARLRNLAVYEMARHTAFDSDVPSLPAQEIWHRIWSERSAPSRPGPPEPPRSPVRPERPGSTDAPGPLDPPGPPTPAGPPPGLSPRRVQGASRGMSAADEGAWLSAWQQWVDTQR
jgi:hypothetical protein